MLLSRSLSRSPRDPRELEATMAKWHRSVGNLRVVMPLSGCKSKAQVMSSHAGAARVIVNPRAKSDFHLSLQVVLPHVALNLLQLSAVSFRSVCLSGGRRRSEPMFRRFQSSHRQLQDMNFLCWYSGRGCIQCKVLWEPDNSSSSLPAIHCTSRFIIFGAKQHIPHAVLP